MRKSLSFIIYFSLLSLVSGDSCCGDSTCSDSCPWNGACNNGRDYSCMDGISGPFKCRDKTVCKDYYDCTDEDVAYRTGQLCRGFPWFNGGFPFDSIKRTDSEIKTYKCQVSSSNNHYCNSWESLENSLDEFEIGEIDCIQESSNSNYCQEWIAFGKEYKKCWTEVTTVYDQEYGYQTRYTNYCCNKDTQSLPCCQNLCSVSFYNNPQIQYERSTCTCKKESDNGRFCYQWYCEEQTIYAMTDTTSDQPIEKEWYTCKTNNLEDTYCPSWNGDIDSTEEFEVATCQCEATNGKPYCNNWTCLEKGYDYWWPNSLWNLLSGLLGGLPLLLLLIYLPLVHNVYFWIGYIIWSAGFILIGVWKAGVEVVLISGSCLYLLPLFIFSVWKCVTVKERPRRAETYITVQGKSLEDDYYHRPAPTTSEYVHTTGDIQLAEVVTL